MNFSFKLLTSSAKVNLQQCKSWIFYMRCVTFKLQKSLQRWKCERTGTLQTAQNSFLSHILNTHLEKIKYAQMYLEKLQEVILPDVSYCQFKCKRSSIQSEQNVKLKLNCFSKLHIRWWKIKILYRVTRCIFCLYLCLWSTYRTVRRWLLALLRVWSNNAAASNCISILPFTFHT